MIASQPLIEVRFLVKYFHSTSGWFTRQRQTVHAVDDVSFTIPTGSVLGLVGESGCGKTTIGRCLLRLTEPTSGEILLDGQDLLGIDRKTLRNLRPQMQMVFQNPLASLNPRKKIQDIVAEPLKTHKIPYQQQQIEELLADVGLGPQHLTRFPHELSGGQCQRVAIARALTLEPRLLVLDEPTSALDISVQAQILNLLLTLKKGHGLTYLFISHDLSVVQYVSDYIGVMYLGKLVEHGPAEDIFEIPLHPYTQALLSAIPKPKPGRKSERVVLQGNVPSPVNPPSGCRFHTRCPLVEPTCSKVEPQLTLVDSDRRVACHIVTQMTDTTTFTSERLN
jgi:oligopeptide transport system ATP-binding protein